MWILNEKTKDAAIAEIKLRLLGKFDENDGCWYEGMYGDNKIKTITLYEVSDADEMPIDEWYSEAKDKTKNFQREHGRIMEREEYERLKKIFG